LWTVDKIIQPLKAPSADVRESQINASAIGNGYQWRMTVSCSWSGGKQSTHQYIMQLWYIKHTVHSRSYFSRILIYTFN
jgi:hypothetical protein